MSLREVPTPMSPDPYKSQLMRYVSRASCHLQEQLDCRLRQTKVALIWSLQAFIFPFYRWSKRHPILNQSFNPIEKILKPWVLSAHIISIPPSGFQNTPHHRSGNGKDVIFHPDSPSASHITQWLHPWVNRLKSLIYGGSLHQNEFSSPPIPPVLDNSLVIDSSLQSSSLTKRFSIVGFTLPVFPLNHWRWFFNAIQVWQKILPDWFKSDSLFRASLLSPPSTIYPIHGWDSVDEQDSDPWTRILNSIPFRSIHSSKKLNRYDQWKALSSQGESVQSITRDYLDSWEPWGQDLYSDGNLIHRADSRSDTGGKFVGMVNGGSEPELFPNWIEINASTLSYFHHPLELVLGWLNQIILRLEKILIKIWTSLRQLLKF